MPQLSLGIIPGAKGHQDHRTRRPFHDKLGLMSLIREMGLGKSQFEMLMEDYHAFWRCDPGARKETSAIQESRSDSVERAAPNNKLP
jgi:hypothetical protein